MLRGLTACLQASVGAIDVERITASIGTDPIYCKAEGLRQHVLVQVLVFGCAYHRIADETVSATTLRRRDEWIAAGLMDALLELMLTAYDRMLGLTLNDIAIDCCITKAPCGGDVAGCSPVDRGKHGRKRSMAIDAAGIPLGTVVAPTSYHDARLLEPTLDALAVTDTAITVHLDRGYDFGRTRQCLPERGLVAEIAVKGQPTLIAAGQRWVVERTTAWTNVHKELLWCTERRSCVIALWLVFSAVLIIMGRLVRESWTRDRWTRDRWDARPRRRPWVVGKGAENLHSATISPHHFQYQDAPAILGEGSLS